MSSYIAKKLLLERSIYFNIFASLVYIQCLCHVNFTSSVLTHIGPSRMCVTQELLGQYYIPNINLKTKYLWRYPTYIKYMFVKSFLLHYRYILDILPKRKLLWMRCCAGLNLSFVNTIMLTQFRCSNSTMCCEDCC